MQLVTDLIAVASVLAMLFFLTYVAGLRSLPTGHRPKTPTYDRYGRVMAETENPDFQETEEEHHR